MKKLAGVVVPLITPLTLDDQIDVPSLERLVDHCIDGGLQCLYPCGTTGEMMYLTLAERKLIAEVVVRQAAGRVPVFVQVGAWNQADTIELARHAESIGADGLGIVTPPFYKLSDRGLIDFYVTVANSVSDTFPVYLYGIPQNATNDVSVAVCRGVADQCKNVVGIKYSYPDMTRIQQFMTVQDGEFDVLVGPDHLFAAVCAMGGKGTVSGNAMIIREHYVKIWDALCAGDQALAAKYQHKTNVLNGVLCAVNNIAAYKVMLKDIGVIETTCMRRPMENLTPQQEEELLTTMKQLNYTQVAEI